MRTTFFILLLANLLFWAWTQWIAIPPTNTDSLSGVPRLALVARDFPPPVPAAAAAPVPAGALGAALAAHAAGVSPGQPNASKLECISVGPFAHDRAAKSAMALLDAHQLVPRLRTVAVKPVHWYWVYLPDVSGAARIKQVLAELQHDGFYNSEPMSTPNGKPGISLGLFPDSAAAHAQLQRARARGFAADLGVRLVAQPAYWLDLWAPGGARGLPVSALQAQFSQKLAVQPCAPGDMPPAPSGTTGAVAPGVPLPSDDATAAPPP